MATTPDQIVATLQKGVYELLSSVYYPTAKSAARPRYIFARVVTWNFGTGRNMECGYFYLVICLPIRQALTLTYSINRRILLIKCYEISVITVLLLLL